MDHVAVRPRRGEGRLHNCIITKKWAWPTDFVWQKSMEVYGKPLTTATSVIAKLPSQGPLTK